MLNPDQRRDVVRLIESADHARQRQS
jgi:hypothetical protein